MAIRILVLASIVCALVACGGGGSSVPTSPAPSTTSSPTASSGTVLVAVYGDSTQSNQGNPHAASRPPLFTIIENHGVSGSTSTQLLATWDAKMAATKAAVVVVNHGLNDGDRTVEQYKDALREFVRVARLHKKVIVLEQPNNAAPHGAFDLAQFNEKRNSIADVAQAEGVYYCSQPDVPLADGAHPTAEGYRLKADRLAECLADLLS